MTALRRAPCCTLPYRLNSYTSPQSLVHEQERANVRDYQMPLLDLPWHSASQAIASSANGFMSLTASDPNASGLELSNAEPPILFATLHLDRSWCWNHGRICWSEDCLGSQATSRAAQRPALRIGTKVPARA